MNPEGVEEEGGIIEVFADDVAAAAFASRLVIIGVGGVGEIPGGVKPRPD